MRVPSSQCSEMDCVLELSKRINYPKISTKMKEKVPRTRKSFSCNPELLKHFRTLKDMTQSDLADATGFSERLIGKAESGKPVSLGAITALANVLSSSERILLPDDLIANPLARARDYIRCIYVHKQNSFDCIKPILHNDIVVHISGNPETVPFAGIYCGLDEVKKAFDVFWSCFEVPEDHDHLPHYQYFAAGSEVVVWGDSWIHPIGFPLRNPLRECYRMTFKAGRIARLDQLIDSDYAATVLQKANDARKLVER